MIPIYNVEEYLVECLESVYRLNIKKEIILVNDESPDNSNLIIERYKNKYPKETIVINQKNKGLSGARNSGLQIARGKYIAFIDSDDFIDSKKYENFFNDNKDKDLDIIIGSYKKYKLKKYLEICRKEAKFYNLEIMTGEEFFIKSLRLKSFFLEIWDDIFRREFLLKNNLKFKEKLLHEDILFFIQALNKAEKVQYIDSPFYIYRQREGSITATSNYKNLRHIIFIVKELINFQEKNKMMKLNGYLIDILWYIFTKQKEVNLKLLNKLIFKEKYCIKTYIKILLMYLASTICKTIEPIEID